MRKLWKSLVISMIAISITFITLLITAYGLVVSFSLFGPLGGVVWLFLAATVFLTLAATYLDDACSKADEWVNR